MLNFQIRKERYYLPNRVGVYSYRIILVRFIGRDIHSYDPFNIMVENDINDVHELESIIKDEELYTEEIKNYSNF